MYLAFVSIQEGRGGSSYVRETNKTFHLYKQRCALRLSCFLLRRDPLVSAQPSMALCVHGWVGRDHNKEAAVDLGRQMEQCVGS